MNEKDKPQMDWQQVVLNGGPPCFFTEGPQYCGRAQRWPGHGNEAFHNYVSLDDLLATTRKEAGEAAFREVIKIAKRFDQGEADKCQRCKIASEIVSTIEAEQEQSLDDLYWQQGHTKR